MARITGFDAKSAPQQGDPLGPLLPEGWYVLAMVESESVTNEKNHIEYLVGKMEVLNQGWNKARIGYRIPYRMETGYNEKDLTDGLKKHLNIGKAQLGFLVNFLVDPSVAFTDTSQLHGKPVGALLQIEEGNGTDSKGNPYPDQNRPGKFVDPKSIDPNDFVKPGTVPVLRPKAAVQPAAAVAAAAWGAAPAAAPAAAFQPPVQQQPAAAPPPPVAAQPAWAAAAPAQQPANQPAAQVQQWAQPPAGVATEPVQQPVAQQPAFVQPQQPVQQFQQPAAAPAAQPAAADEVPPWLRGQGG